MLDRIKNKSNRPSVQRDTSLTGKDTETQSAQNSTQDLKTQVEALPEVAPRRNIRLIEDIDLGLNQLCQQQGITVETFLEACYLMCDREPELMQSVIGEALSRLKDRKKAGKLRRIYSQLKNV